MKRIIFSLISTLFLLATNISAQMGACCIPQDGSCQDLTEMDCDINAGNWQDVPTTCGTFTCPPALGAGLLIDQTFNCDLNNFISSLFIDIGGVSVDNADDFVVPTGDTFFINEVQVEGLYTVGSGPADSIDVIVYQDNGSDLPGAVACTYNGLPYTVTGGDNFVVTLPTSCDLAAGKYWLQVRPQMQFFTAGVWNWRTTSIQYGEPFAFQDPDTLVLGSTCLAWDTHGDCNLGFEGTTESNCFSISGDRDSDGDGVRDSVDICAGFDDNLDQDADGTPTGCDQCDDDATKIAPGACGCGNPDLDEDNNSVIDCLETDACPDDPNKDQPGVCGCGIADTDTDSDSTLDCNEECDSDPNKTEAGVCGCGIADIDSNENSIVDCLATDSVYQQTEVVLERLATERRRVRLWGIRVLQEQVDALNNEELSALARTVRRMAGRQKRRLQAGRPLRLSRIRNRIAELQAGLQALL